MSNESSSIRNVSDTAVWVAMYRARESERLADGVDLVVNLAAGFDSRPYRMDLPSSLRWVEVDLPDILSYKEAILDSERPNCRRDRVALDLADGEERRALFQRLASESKKALIVSEGLLIYLDADQARSLGSDLSNQPILPLVGLRHRLARPPQDAPEAGRHDAGPRQRPAQIRPGSGTSTAARS